MKAASVVFKPEDLKESCSYGKLMVKVEGWLEQCRRNGIELVVFPALLGCLFGDGEKYINDIQQLSVKYKGLAICPGSFRGEEFYSYSIIHGPLEMTEKESGLLAVEEKQKKAPLITAELDNSKRKAAI
ncbi:MAG: hypothetical protein ACM3TR_08870 [Caulobacteraceae bacterium]